MKAHEKREILAALESGRKALLGALLLEKKTPSLRNLKTETFCAPVLVITYLGEFQNNAWSVSAIGTSRAHSSSSLPIPHPFLIDVRGSRLAHRSALQDLHL